MKNFLVTYIKPNNQKVVALAKGNNVEEVQSFFNQRYPLVKIINIKKTKRC